MGVETSVMLFRKAVVLMLVSFTQSRRAALKISLVIRGTNPTIRMASLLQGLRDASPGNIKHLSHSPAASTSPTIHVI